MTVFPTGLVPRAFLFLESLYLLTQQVMGTYRKYGERGGGKCGDKKKKFATLPGFSSLKMVPSLARFLLVDDYSDAHM